MTNKKHTIATLFALTIGTVGTGSAAADCQKRLDEVRQLQARTPMLDAQRPDLAQMREVARALAARGKEALCMELANDLAELVEDHREHVDKVEALANYATAAPITEINGDLGSKRLLSMPVRSRVGAELGEVSGIDIDASSGTVRALEISSGGFLGMGQHRAQIPWSKVHLTRDGAAVVLDMTAEELEKQADNR